MLYAINTETGEKTSVEEIIKEVAEGLKEEYRRYVEIVKREPLITKEEYEAVKAGWKKIIVEDGGKVRVVDRNYSEKIEVRGVNLPKQYIKNGKMYGLAVEEENKGIYVPIEDKRKEANNIERRGTDEASERIYNVLREAMSGFRWEYQEEILRCRSEEDTKTVDVIWHAHHYTKHRVLRKLYNWDYRGVKITYTHIPVVETEDIKVEKVFNTVVRYEVNGETVSVKIEEVANIASRAGWENNKYLHEALKDIERGIIALIAKEIKAKEVKGNKRELKEKKTVKVVIEGEAKEIPFEVWKEGNEWVLTVGSVEIDRRKKMKELAVFSAFLENGLNPRFAYSYMLDYRDIVAKCTEKEAAEKVFKLMGAI